MKNMLLTHNIAQESLSKVLQPISTANGLPNAAYVDPAVFTYEREYVLGKTWAGLAFTNELPEPGYAKPVNFMGLPLAIMRNLDGDINVFHNVCSHRGMVLLRTEQEVKGTISCPYHCWTYDLNGRLKGTPHFGGSGKHKIKGFARDKHGLKAVRSAVWMGMIFINLTGDAENFESFINPLLQRWEEFTGKNNLQKVYLATTGSEMQLTVKSNWKLAVENYCEAYHLPWVHPALNKYSPLQQHHNLIVNDYLSGQGTYSYNPIYNLNDELNAKVPEFAHWSEDKIHHAEYLSLYPNVLLGVQADHVFAIILKPQAVDSTLEKLQIYYVGKESSEDQYSACRNAILGSWKVVFEEDIFAVEGMQAGRCSPGFEGGVFSEALDVCTHHFHRWIASKYNHLE